MYVRACARVDAYIYIYIYILHALVSSKACIPAKLRIKRRRPLLNVHLATYANTVLRMCMIIINHHHHHII